MPMIRGRARRGALMWFAAAITISLVVVLPVGVVLSSLLRSSDGAWAHLAETRLGEYIGNTLGLSAAVGALALAIGVPTAWLITMHRFPGRNVLAWGLMLPLAVPGYIAAYSFTDLLQFSGPVQTWLRDGMGLDNASRWFPEIRSFGGAVVVLAFTLYPYVYLAARSAFAGVSRSALEASRTLGRGPFGTLYFVVLPLARPALMAATMLVIMETAADFGTVDYFAVDTLATGVYRTWFGLDSPTAASQLASLLLAIVFVLFVLETAARRQRRFHDTSRRTGSAARTSLGPVAGIAASGVCVVPIFIGFVAPGAWLAVLAIRHGDSRAMELFASHGTNSFVLAALSAIAAVVLGLLVVFAWRQRGGIGPRITMDLCRAGYAIPGPVIAIGVLAGLGFADRRLNEAWAAAGGAEPLGLIFTGSVIALLVGYQTRFLAVAVSLIESGYSRVHRNMDAAARLLSARPTGVLLRVHVPALRGTLLAAGLVVFVDVVKELPATLMLRPFNVETLAVRVYQLASDERLNEAATGALAIVIVGMLPVVLLARGIDRERRSMEETGT